MRSAILAGLFTLLISTTSQAEAQLDSVGVWRVQVRLHTCDVKNAGTDDSVWLSLDGVNHYYIDNGGNDRERDDWNTYDVVFPGVDTVGDIGKIQLGKAGSDAWCVDDVQLVINSPSASGTLDNAHTIYDASNVSRWIDGDGSFPAAITIASSTGLRSSPLWNLSSPRNVIDDLIIQIPDEVLEKIFEGIIGNEMGPGNSMEDLKWGTRDGSDYVEATHPSTDPANRIRVDLDLATENSNGRTEFRDVDVDFWVTVTCDSTVSPAQLTLAISNVDADASMWMNILTFGIAGAVANKLSNGITLSETTNAPFCPSWLGFTSDGTLWFF